MSLSFPVRRTALSFALLAMLSSLHAQPVLPEVVVSASRAEQRVQDALPASTLITREQIDAAQTPDLPTLLRRVAGLELTQTGGQGTVSGVFLRGAESRHTLVLVDGVPINNLNFGLPALEHVPLADVERIEVVRGDVSSLYGSSAIGGVIQIFTRRATATPQASITLQAGSRGLVEGSATGAMRTAGGTGIRATVEGLRDGGFNATSQAELPGTNPDRDGYRRRAASMALTQDLAGGHSIGLKLRDARGTTEYDSQFGPDTQRDASRFVEQQAVLDGHFHLAPDLQLDAGLTHAADRLDADETAFPFFVNSRLDAVNLGLQWRAAPGQTLTAGLEHSRHHIESDTAYARNEREVDSARIGYILDGARHQLQLNLRHDRYSDFGDANTWLAAYGYRLSDALRASASLSTGFRAPSFNDLFFPFGIGNPDLRPERVRSAELGLEYALPGQTLRATVFRNRFTDLIASPPPTFATINIGRARTQGLELAYNGRFMGNEIQAGLTHQDPRDLDTGLLLPRRARNFGNFALSRSVGAWQWGGNLRASSHRADGSQRLGGYAVLDLTAAWRMSPQVKLFGRVENVFDRAYETAFGFRQAPRGVFVGLQWQPQP